jgi:hypothetical protein
MSVTESIVEDAALILPAATLTRPLPEGEEWELGYAVGHGPHLAPGEYAGGTLIPAFSQREKESEQGKLVGSLREAIRRLNPANACGNPHPASPKGRGEEASACASHADKGATGKRYLQVQIERRPNP